MLDPSFASSLIEPISRPASPLWARWNGELDQRYTLGVEEELMLLTPGSWSLAESSDEVLARLPDDLALHTSTETHAAVLELITGVHPDVDGVLAELQTLRHRLSRELRVMGVTAAAAGTHPLNDGTPTKVSSAARYRLLEESMRVLARREPTMALHMHIGVPHPDDAVRLLNALRRTAPILLALSANSPFYQGRDGGFASTRTLIFQAFPRTGLPRVYANYTDYVEAVDGLISSGAIPDPSFLWWDMRLQPALGTVEVRIMDAQTTLGDTAALVALVQSLAHLELEGDDLSTAEPSAEVLAENRFLAARDGMDARLIDPAANCLVPVRDMLDALVARCRPHALALGCAPELERVLDVAADNGADRQRALAARDATLDHLPARLAYRFLTPYARVASRGRDELGAMSVRQAVR
jgi:carboxylate-amine ligase